MGGTRKTSRPRTPRAKARAAGNAKPRPMSLLAYAKRRGLSAEAVCKAVRSGRLERSIVVVRGKPKIADPELADREWENNTRTARPPKPRRDSAASDVVPDSGVSYSEARRRREVELWRQSRIKREADALDLGVKKGELIPVDEARAAVMNSFTIVRTRLLGVPTRCKQRLAILSSADVGVIDDLVREALEELAGEEEAGH